MTNLYGEKQYSAVILEEVKIESLSSLPGKNADKLLVLESSNQPSSSGAVVRVLSAVCIPGWYC